MLSGHWVTSFKCQIANRFSSHSFSFWFWYANLALWKMGFFNGFPGRCVTSIFLQLQSNRIQFGASDCWHLLSELSRSTQFPLSWTEPPIHNRPSILTNLKIILSDLNESILLPPFLPLFLPSSKMPIPKYFQHVFATSTRLNQFQFPKMPFVSFRVTRGWFNHRYCFPHYNSSEKEWIIRS